MKNIFTEHPHEVGESYFQHFKFAASFGITMIGGGIACLIHAIFPCFFEKTGSQLLLKMTNHFISRTPQLDSRVSALGDLIETKRKNTSHFS